MFPVRQRRGAVTALLVIIFLVGLTSGALVVTADSEFDLTISDVTDTPSDTVEFEGDEFEVSAVAVRDPGEEITATASLPDEEFSSIEFLLYNSDEQIEVSRQVFDPDESETETLPTVTPNDEDLPPGTYSVNLEVEGSTEGIHPVVLSGYDISVSHPDEVAADSEIDIDITVDPTELSEQPASGVEAVVWNDAGNVATIEAEQDDDDDDEYTATFEPDKYDGFEDGDDLDVYAAALGDEEFRGENEILALDGGSSFSITEADDDGSNGNGDDNGGNGANGGTDDGAGGGGGGGEASPTVSLSQPVEDENPGEAGTTITFSDSNVQSLTFSNDVSSGTVTVEQYDGTAPGAPGLGDRPLMASVVIDVSDELTDEAATFQITVDQTELLRADVDPEGVAVLKATENGYETLETTVIDGSGDPTLEASTPGFSAFVVSTDEGDISTDDGDANGDNGDADSPDSEEADPEPEPEDEGVIEPSDEDGEPPVEDQSLSLGVVVVGLLTALVVAFRRR